LSEGLGITWGATGREWEGEHDEGRLILDTARPGVEGLRSRILGFRGCPCLGAPQGGRPIKQGGDQPLAKALPLVCWRHPDLVDEHLRFLVRVHIVNTARHTNDQTIFGDGNGKVVAGIRQELARQVRPGGVVEDFWCDPLEDRVLSWTQDSDSGHEGSFV
jgi:hypothetical protein